MNKIIFFSKTSKPTPKPEYFLLIETFCQHLPLLYKGIITYNKN